jgi:hypothetical protein
MDTLSSTVRWLQFAILSSVCCFLSGVVVAQNQPAPATSSPGKSPDEIHQLWTANITSMLTKPIPTNSNDSYYTGELMMVPLHAAFARKDTAWEQDFADHFLRLSQSHVTLTDVTLSRLQYLYLASQFIVVAKNAGCSDLIPKGLPDFIFDEIRTVWYDEPASQYAHPPFKGMKERVLYKLDHPHLEKNYYRAILDAEYFEFAIAADIRNYFGLGRAAGESTINDILAIAERTSKQEIAHTSSGGWVLQPGVFSDHPDFLYAGNPRLAPGLRPAPVRGIGWDSSHFGRWALFLRSLINAYAPGSPERSFYSDLENGLNSQFFDRILVPPSADFPCYRLNNFTDGSNGVYRWGYATMGPNNGYGPYQVSGALLVGWWSFLGTDQVHAMYRKVADQYPWPPACVDLYLGPTVGGHARTQSEIDASASVMKLRYLLVRLASEL